MEQTNLYASPLSILGRLFILNIEPNSVVTCPFYRPIPAPMLISELNRDQISLMWDIIYGQININMWTTSVKINREKLEKNCRNFFQRISIWSGGVAGERSGALEWVPCHIQLFIHFTVRKGLNTSKYVSRKSRKYGKSWAPRCRTKAFLRHSRVELSQLIPGRILCEHVALL